MIPYVSFPYFLFLLYPLGVLVILGFSRRLGRWSIVAVSAAVLALQYGDSRQLAYFAAYVAWSLVLIRGFAYFRTRGAGRRAYYAAVTLALAPLAVVKAATTGGSGLFDTVGFLGISYLTFRLLDVLILIEDEVLAGPPAVGALLAYLMFFPTISAGPIDRFRRFVSDLNEPGAYGPHVEAGIHRIAQGFLYKFILAYLIDRYALVPAGHIPGLWGELAYMYAYSLYLFFDFAGYSAFAIGAGHFLGITVPENFNRPFSSANFREMWNRWHMTLSFWFRDHVYMRFVLGATRRRWFRGNRRAASYAGFLVTMGLMGAWHGLALHFIVYGLYQGAMLVAYDFLGRWNRRRQLVRLPAPLAKAASVALTFNLFCFGLLIFSGHLF